MDKKSDSPKINFSGKVTGKKATVNIAETINQYGLKDEQFNQLVETIKIQGLKTKDNEKFVSHILNKLDKQDLSLTQLNEIIFNQAKQINELLSSNEISDDIKSLIKEGDFDQATSLIEEKKNKNWIIRSLDFLTRYKDAFIVLFAVITAGWAFFLYFDDKPTTGEQINKESKFDISGSITGDNPQIYFADTINQNGESISPQNMIDCPEGFSPTGAMDNSCTMSGEGCNYKSMNSARICGVIDSWTNGTAVAMIVPHPWIIKRYVYSNLVDSFSSRVPKNLILCEAHGVTPDCGDSLRRGDDTNIVGWHVTIIPERNNE